MARQLDNPTWNAGYDAYFNGANRDDNPFPEGSVEEDVWDEGWDTADSDADDEMGESDV